MEKKQGCKIGAFEEFVKVQGKLGNVGKNREVKGGYGYSYTDLGELLDCVRPALREHHFVVVWELAEMHGRFVIVCKVLWKDGTCVAQSACPILGVHEQGGGRLNPMQEVGSAITYARRYTLLNCLCVACEDDDAQSLSPKPQTPVLMDNDNGY
jgi:hypothetical protein